MGRDGNTRPGPFSVGIPVPLTPMTVLENIYIGVRITVVYIIFRIPASCGIRDNCIPVQ